MDGLAILERIHAHGGAVVRDQWRFSIRRGRMTDAALAWVAARAAVLFAAVWPEFDAWAERAAIREFCGGQSRAEAEVAAYAEVMGC